MTANWTQVEKLVEDQRYEEARRVLGEMRGQARKAKQDGELARALVREAQLLAGQGQFETAAEFLLGEALPESAAPRAAVELGRAAILSNYLTANSWEIRRRERIGTETVDVRLLTADEIQQRILTSFLAAWKEREALGKLERGSFYEVFDPNDYPAKVRGTVRDSLSYVFAEALVDSAWWSPRQAREVHRLALDRLLEQDGSWREATLASPEAHPLERLSAVLGDLEAWHRQAGDSAAALEARRVLSEKLAQAFERDADKQRVRVDFARRLEEFRAEPWWSMGMSTLAELLRAEPREEAWSEALAVAERGATAYAKSPGAAACRAIRRQLEAREIGGFSSPRSLPSSSSGRPTASDALKLEVESRNLRQLHLRAYPVDVAGRLAAGQSPWPDYQEIRALLRGAPGKAWTVELPATPLLRLVPSRHSLPITQGAWAVFGSVRSDFAEEENTLRSLYVVAGDLALVGGGNSGASGVLAVRASSGEARSGVDLEVYRNDYQSRSWRRVSTSRTGDDGWAPLAGDGQYPHAVLARGGGDIALLDSFSFFQANHPVDEDRSLVFTDRSIYRPGQTVLWKALMYRQGAGEPKPARGATVTISLVDPNGETVASTTAASNDFGTASGELAIPPSGRLLGEWTVLSSAQGVATIRVEEYKRPTFEARFLDPKAPLRLNQPARFVGEARYYFGLPLSRGSVTWRVLREPVMPPYWECRCWGWWMRPAREEILATGESKVASDGTFPVEFTPAADERLADDHSVSYRYRIVAAITDEGGETRDVERAFRLGFAAVESRFELGPGLRVEGQPSRATIHRTDLSGTPRAGTGQWRLLLLRQPETPILPGDRAPDLASAPRSPRRGGVRAMETYDPAAELRRWSDGGEIAASPTRHGETSLEIELPSLKPGAYRLRYSTSDEFGATAESVARTMAATLPGAIRGRCGGPIPCRRGRFGGKVQVPWGISGRSGAAWTASVTKE